MNQDRDRRTLESLRRAARELDRQPQLLTAAARLRAMLPGDDRFGDALSLSGRDAHQLVGKGLAAVQPERESLLNEIGRAGLQLWQAAVASRRGLPGDAEVTLLFTDLVEFSTWALHAGDENAVHLLREVADESDAIVRAYGGRMVKHLGDGWMAVFPDPGSAVAAGLELHQQIGALQAEGYHPRLRTGIHSGRPQALGGDYLGVDVNVTARVSEAARPGELLITEVVADHLGDAPGVALGRPRRLRAPGTPRDMRVRRVEAEEF